MKYHDSESAALGTITDSALWYVSWCKQVDVSCISNGYLGG